MRFAVCDDDVNQGEWIGRTLRENFPGQGVTVDRYENGQELVEAIQRGEKYQILLLDIEMPQLNGVETAHKIKELLPDGVIIFVTSFYQHVTAALETSPFQFLLKPVKQEELIRQVTRAMEYLSGRDFTITLHYKGEETTVKASDIVFVESSGKYLLVHGRDRDYRVMGKISRMEEQLHSHGFFRIHRCILLNLRFVQRIEKEQVCCVTGERLALSKQNRQPLIKAYGQYILGDGGRA